MSKIFHRTRCQLYRAFIIFLAQLYASFGASAQTDDDRFGWLDRPWELQYVVYVTERWGRSVRVAKELTETNAPDDLELYWKTLFEPVSFHQSRHKWASPGEGLTVVLIEFERDGKVKTPHHFDRPLYGRIDKRLYVRLSPGDYATQPRFSLGEWFMGLGDISTHWAPGLCNSKQMPSPFARTYSGYLYGPAYSPSWGTASFGCREWAYQLGDPGRPYIDITSYFPKNADPGGSGTYVFSTMGWARFNDDRKPIIGRHEDDWFCLHDCPGGDKPGLIPDIKAWAAKNGWPVPKPPTRIPVFPDPPAKPGRYPQ
ncbi:hypothetical protein [Rubrivivax gelatinosus]|uniref:Uncharacterized protein n=1 Tax=Rubrivivax gelatinosus (strain NBRC 100245 / IL144) TaxID=983917 RepID=I0HSD5_RUBGI|nr:hypothetical protein [Rubrivivax gelatinosus]BAL95922.1 hypothetical protein RGE_25830 [Rubrivivax gelatinosus IL144]